MMNTMNKIGRRVLVTGGAGFIGSHVVPRLLELGHHVTVLDNLSSGKLENLKGSLDHPKFLFYRGDIIDKDVLNEAFDDVDSVIHLAALIDVSSSVVDPVQNHEVNVNGTFNMLQAAVKCEVKKFVFASSTAVYGDAEKLPIKEDVAIHPLSPYAASKAAGEAYCSAFAHCFGLKTATLRFFNVYGSGSEKSPYSGVITVFLKKIVRNDALTIDGDGRQTRDFIQVDDVVKALTLALEQDRLKGEVLNVCTGVPTSINQLAATLEEVTGKKVRVNHGPPRVGDIRCSYGDPAKALKNMGFKASVDLSQGLRMLLADFKT